MRIPTEVEAVVFDCDGLLAETESAWTRAETAVFREHGHGFGVEQKKLLLGKTLTSGGQAMADYFGRPDEGPALASHLANLVWRELKAGTPALPGAAEIVQTLKRRSIPVAVASNSPAHFVEAALTSAGLHDLFEIIVSADDVEHGKPAPDLYLTACARLLATPQRSVAFEDSGTGVASARAAGMFVIAVPSVLGSELPADATFGSLTHPDLTAWASASWRFTRQDGPGEQVG